MLSNGIPRSINHAQLKHLDQVLADTQLKGSRARFGQNVNGEAGIKSTHRRGLFQKIADRLAHSRKRVNAMKSSFANFLNIDVLIPETVTDSTINSEIRSGREHEEKAKQLEFQIRKEMCKPSFDIAGVREMIQEMDKHLSEASTGRRAYDRSIEAKKDNADPDFDKEQINATAKEMDRQLEQVAARRMARFEFHPTFDVPARFLTGRPDQMLDGFNLDAIAQDLDGMLANPRTSPGGSAELRLERLTVHGASDFLTNR